MISVKSLTCTQAYFPFTLQENFLNIDDILHSGYLHMSHTNIWSFWQIGLVLYDFHFRVGVFMYACIELYTFWFHEGLFHFRSMWRYLWATTLCLKKRTQKDNGRPRFTYVVSNTLKLHISIIVFFNSYYMFVLCYHFS